MEFQLTILAGIIIVGIAVIYGLFCLLLALAYGIPYMIGMAKYKLSCMTKHKEKNHGQKEK